MTEKEKSEAIIAIDFSTEENCEVKRIIVLKSAAESKVVLESSTNKE